MRIRELLYELDQLDEVLPALGPKAPRPPNSPTRPSNAQQSSGVVGQQDPQGLQGPQGPQGPDTSANKNPNMSLAAAKKISNANMRVASKLPSGALKKVTQHTNQALAKTLLRKGTKLTLPTDQPNSAPEEFEVDNLNNDEVTLVNPKPKPGEPKKTVHKTSDFDDVIRDMAQSK